MKKVFMYLLSVLAAMLFVVSAYAQVTTSAITGKVSDASGAVNGAAVIATYTPSGASYYAVSDANGQYRINGVIPGGPYEVKVEILGYRSSVINGFYTAIGETSVADFTLQEEAIGLEAVVVSADASESGMNIRRSGAGTSVSLKTMENMPTSTGRSLNDVLRLTPQANTGGSGFSVGGGNYRSSYITVDGAAFNNAFGIGSNLPAGGSPISLDAIEQMSINITPYDVRQGGFTGAAVNSVTKRGTNEFKLSVYDYYTSGKIQGRNYVKSNGEKAELPLTEAFSNTVGASIGGPIIKNKLFFFANFEYEPKSSVATTNLANNGSWTPGAGGNVTRPTAAEMNSIKEFLSSKYNYDPGRFENFSVGTPIMKFLGRLDWNINNNPRLTLRYSQVTRKTVSSPSSSINPVGDGPANIGYTRKTGGRSGLTTALPFESTYYFTDDNFYSFAGELNSSFLDGRMTNMLRGTYSHQYMPRSFYGGNFPTVDILKDGTVFTTFGPDPFTYGNLRDVETMVFTDELSYTSGIHNFILGAQFEHNRTRNGFMQGGAGWYVYDSWESFKNDATPVSFAITHGNNDELAQVFPSFDYNQLSFYVQDELNISDNFKFTAGIRFEVPMFPDITGNENRNFTNIYANYGGFKTSDMPAAKLNVSPRIGFNWDILGDRSLILRGGTGFYTGRIPFVWIVSVAGNSNSLQNQVIMKASDISASTDGKVSGVTIPHFHTNVADITSEMFGGAFKRNENLAAPTGATILDKNLRMPETWKASLALDAKLPGDIRASVEGIFNKNFSSTVVHRQGYTTSTFQLPGEPSARTQYNAIPAVGKVLPYMITNPAKGVDQGFYTSVTASLKKDFNWGLSLMAAYTYSVAKALTDGDGDQVTSAFTNNIYTVNGTNADELGYSSFVAPHRVIGSASYTVKEGRHMATNFSLFYEGYNYGFAGQFAASRYSYTFDADYTGLGGSPNLIYIPTSAQLKAMPWSSEDNRNAFESFIAADKYLSKHRGQYATRGGAVMPWFSQLSAKVSQDFMFNALGREHTIRLGVDINNLGNLLNPAWGNVKQMQSNAALSYKGGVYTFDNEKCRFETYAGALSTWSILFSARYFF